MNLGLLGVPVTRAKYCFCIVFSLHIQVTSGLMLQAIRCRHLCEACPKVIDLNSWKLQHKKSRLFI